MASDANGDYVVAWTDTTPGHQGVWAKMYQQTSTLNADGTPHHDRRRCGRQSGSFWANNEFAFRPTPRPPTFRWPADVDGDFVVTWSAYNATTSWDVFAQRFNAAGQPQGSIFRVNTSVNVTADGGVTSYLNDVQRDSSVAMDAQGDFVITWQSNNQDGSGYGVYAQAYNAAGEAVGGTDEVQAIDFTGGFTGTFKLRWDNDNNPATPDLVSAPITFTGNVVRAADGRSKTP